MDGVWSREGGAQGRVDAWHRAGVWSREGEALEGGRLGGRAVQELAQGWHRRPTEGQQRANRGLAQPHRLNGVDVHCCR